MFLRRSQKNVIEDAPLADDIELPALTQPDLELSRIPGMFYLSGLLLIGFSMYLFSSASGSDNAIQGFNTRQWWQYLIAMLPLGFGISFIIVNKIEKLRFYRKADLIVYQK